MMTHTIDHDARQRLADQMAAYEAKYGPVVTQDIVIRDRQYLSRKQQQDAAYRKRAAAK